MHEFWTKCNIDIRPIATEILQKLNVTDQTLRVGLLPIQTPLGQFLPAKYKANKFK